MRGKKENLKTAFFALGTINLKEWLPRVLLSLFGFRWAATEKSVSLRESLYIKDRLAVFLPVVRVSQLSDTFSKSGPLRFRSEKSLPSNFAR